MSMLDWFRGRPAPQPPILPLVERAHGDPEHEQRPNGLSVADDGEPRAAIDGVAFGLEYADTVGEVSVRRVIASRIVPAEQGTFYIDAWCLLRNDWRTFRSDRILSLLVPPQWTPVGDPVAYLRGLVPPDAGQPSVVDLVAMKAICRDGLAVLLYVARSDGALPPAVEREVIQDYIAAVCRQHGAVLAEGESSELEAYALTLYPTEPSMVACALSLQRDPNALALVGHHLGLLVRADGAVSTQEREAMIAFLRPLEAVKESTTPETSSAVEASSAAATDEFFALDVETANADMSSICAIGLVRFVGGQVAEQSTTLIDPQAHFDPMNMSIHGIGPQDVAGAKTMREVFPDLASQVGCAIVVHHTHFDRVALARAAAKHGFGELGCRWLDSARVARRAWERFSRRGYGLANLADEFGIRFAHHDACEDARAAGLVMLRAVADSGVSIVDWISRVEAPIAEGAGERVVRSGDPAGPLAGTIVAFTGQLGMTRADAADVAAAAGMKVEATVTRRTSLLVVGDQDLGRLEGHEKSAKHRKAEELIRDGAALRILSETEFRTLLDAHGQSLDRSRRAVSADERRRPNIPVIDVGFTSPEAKRISALCEAVAAAKREKRHDEARVLLMEEIERQERESAATGGGVAPWYYEQLAIVYRKEDRHEDELAILERYDRQIKAPGAHPAQLKIRLDKVRARLKKAQAGKRRA